MISVLIYLHLSIWSISWPLSVWSFIHLAFQVILIFYHLISSAPTEKVESDNGIWKRTPSFFLGSENKHWCLLRTLLLIPQVNLLASCLSTLVDPYFPFEHHHPTTLLFSMEGPRKKPYLGFQIFVRISPRFPKRMSGMSTQAIFQPNFTPKRSVIAVWTSPRFEKTHLTFKRQYIIDKLTIDCQVETGLNWLNLQKIYYGILFDTVCQKQMNHWQLIYILYNLGL